MQFVSFETNPQNVSTARSIEMFSSSLFTQIRDDDEEEDLIYYITTNVVYKYI